MVEFSPAFERKFGGQKFRLHYERFKTKREAQRRAKYLRTLRGTKCRLYQHGDGWWHLYRRDKRGR